MRFAALVLLAFSTHTYAQEFDLLLKGGTVIDPRNGTNAVRDVAIKGDRIAAVEPNIAANRATRVADVRSLYVVPGLIDLHVHVYAGTGVKAYNGDLSVYPDNHSFRACTTTMVDAGSSGWQTFPDFKQRVIDRSQTRVLAMLNIVGRGMAGEPVENDLGDMDARKTADVALANRDRVVGIKTAHYAGPEWIPVDKAVEAGRLANVPVMVDFGIFRAERPHSELVLKHLRPGDIYTHFYLSRVPMLDDKGKVSQYLWDARKRGIIFDAGHGGGSFVFRHAIPAAKQGLFPDSISTDLHVSSMNAGMKDIVNVMSKFLNLNMPLADVIKATTWNPAREIKREELGHLTAGATADIAVLRVDKGEFGFMDVEGYRMNGSQRLGCEMTVMGGSVKWDLNARASEPWERSIGNPPR